MDPVGLEHTTMAVTCFSLAQGGLSGGDLVFVCESAEDLLAADPVPGEVDLRWLGGSLSRCELAEGPVRPGFVVVQQAVRSLSPGLA
jgi:hypothetical protein